MRVAIMHQGFIPRYRVAFFEQLNAQTSDEYVVFYGEPPADHAHSRAVGPFPFPTVKLGARVSYVCRPVIL